jgi:hypothetical protein
MEQTVFETSAYKIQTPGNYPAEQLHWLSPAVLDEGKWSSFHPDHFTPGKELSVHFQCFALWALRAVPRFREKKNILPFPKIVSRYLGRPPRSLVTVSMSYPG